MHFVRKKIMAIILFILALAILILVHELGHFLTAKKMGMRVDEFGIGFPPRIFAIKKGETEYSFNLIPLGGFVKIFGEDPDEEALSGKDCQRSMVNKPKWSQLLVISAGIISNIIFAWILISIGFMVGLPVSVDKIGIENVKNPRIVVVEVMKNSPAMKAGLETGDKLISFKYKTETLKNFSESKMQQFISSHGGENLKVVYERGINNLKIVNIIPVEGVLKNKPAIGISTDVIGISQLSPFKAIWEGLILTLSLIGAVVMGLIGFIASLFNGTGSFSQLTGPVGIIGMVGTASQFGWIYLLNFVAFISINLAVINLIPFPALDGGRLFFTIIEMISRKNIEPKVLNTLNTLGFILLITLMIAVTYNDILKLF